MAKNELKKLHKKITQNNIHLQSHSAKYNFEKIVQNFKTITNQDRPDGIVLLGDTVFVLEHFQISIYTDEQHQDLYQKAMGPKNKYFEKNPDRIIKTEELFPQKMKLLESFHYSLASHLKDNSYEAYMEKARKQYPDKKYAFILVVEDNSQDILIDSLKRDQSLSILDIAECVNEILQHSEIDGVISYNTSPRGDFLLAEDSVYLQEQRDKGNLISVEFSVLCSALQRILVSESSNYSEKEIKQLKELKYMLERALNLSEEVVCRVSVSIEKK